MYTVEALDHHSELGEESQDEKNQKQYYFFSWDSNIQQVKVFIMPFRD